MIALTIALIVITAATSIFAFKRHAYHSKWIFNPYLVYSNHQYWRFISSGFIHANYLHLLLNMVALYFFGKTVEYILTLNHGFLIGKTYFIILFLGGIIVANIPTYFKYRNLPRYNSLGASGGVASVLFGSILYRPVVPLFNVSFLPAFLLGILYLTYTYFQGRRMEDNVNHDAHFYGALFGIVFTIALNPDVIIGFFDQISNFRLF